MPDITVRRYTAPTMTFTLTDREGEVIDISGYTLRFAAKRSFDDLDSEKLFDIEATVVSGPDGTYSLEFSRSQTAFPPGSYVSELRYWSSGGPPDTPTDFEASSFTVTDAVVVNET